jgi:hypothetical protein
MTTSLSRTELLQAYELLDRTSTLSGVRELTALSLRLDGWLEFGAQIPLPGGGVYEERGHPLFERSGRTTWLLPGGRLLHVPQTEAGQAEIEELVDADIDTGLLCDQLRSELLAGYLGGQRLDEIESPMIPRVVADLLSIVWTMGPAGRTALLRALADAMRPGDGWGQAAARLKSGFERGLGDRSEEAADVCARALVRIASGLGPQPPTGDPMRILVVLFTVPRPVVRIGALVALADLPDERLEPLADTAEPLVHHALADANADVRRHASLVERKLNQGGEAALLAQGLEDMDSERRASVLERLARRPGRQFDVLLPLVLDAAADDDPSVRATALDALRAAMEHESEDMRRHVLLSLLEAPDVGMVRTGLELLGESRDLADEQVVGALRVALDGPADNRVGVAEALAEMYRDQASDEAVAGYEMFLRHADPSVRRVGIRRLAADARDRVLLRDGLFQTLVEHLRDPEPELRVETALTIVELRYGRAADLVSQLAFDSQTVARHGLAYVLRHAGAPAVEERAARTVAAVDTLFDMASDGRGDARVKWAAALDVVAEDESPRVPELLASLLATIPADTADLFLQFAIEEIDDRLLERYGDDTIVTVCRQLLQPPAPQPEHAARLASAVAAMDPVALDFLWTLYSATEGSSSDAARRALADVAARPKSGAVEAAIADLQRHAMEPSERDILRTLLTSDGTG